MQIHQTDILTYKSKVVFPRMIVSHFDRVIKEHIEKEVCFVFVDEDEISVRAPKYYIHLTNNSRNVDKCIPYFVEHSNFQLGFIARLIVLCFEIPHERKAAKRCR